LLFWDEKVKNLFILFLILWLSISLFSSDLTKKYNLKTKVDEKHGITWYIHKNNMQSRSRIYLYIGKINKDNKYFLKLRINYYAPINLFIKEYVFKIDDDEYTLTPRKTIQTYYIRSTAIGTDDLEEENSGETICETYDVSINSEELVLMEKIANSKKTSLKYQGVKGYKRVKIHKSSIEAIRDVLDAFKEMVKSQ